MFDEAREAPAAVARLMAADVGAYTSLGEQLRADPPRSALTVARGSSDHAANYCAYLIMARLGRIVALDDQLLRRRNHYRDHRAPAPAGNVGLFQRLGLHSRLKLRHGVHGGEAHPECQSVTQTL